MNKENKLSKWYYIAPLVLIILIVPLIVRLKVIPLSGATYEFWNGERTNNDFFSYYKMVALLTFTGITLIMLFVKYYKENFQFVKKTYFFIPIFLYSLFAILSTAFSQYKGISLNGFVDRYEGMYVLIAYMILLLSTICLVESKKQIKILIGAFIILSVIIGTIGLLQFLGHDLWESDFGKNLMLPHKYKKYASNLKFNFGENVVYSTLYHYNYVGSFVAMFFPLFFTMFLLVKNKLVKLILGLLSILLFVNMVISHSRAGVVGGVFALFILIIVLNKFLIKNLKFILLGIIAFTFLFIGFNKVSNGGVSKRLASLKEQVKIFMKSTDEEQKKASENIPLKNIIIDGNVATIVTDKERLSVEYGNGKIYFKDENKKTISSKYDQKSGSIVLLDEKYKNYKISLNKINGKGVIIVNKSSILLYFALDRDGLHIVNNKGNNIEIGAVEHWGFEGKERMGSARGYIWSRSIPLLKKTILLGHGPDTFAIYFPQYDFKGKMYAYNGDMWQLVDKPHDYYLQVGINTGILSLVSLLVLFLMYFILSIKVFIKNNYNDFYSIAGVSVFVGTMGYLGAAFFNDSVVSVAPLFWILLGIGISINLKISKGDISA